MFKKNCREEEETQMVGRIKALKHPKWAKIMASGPITYGN